MNTTANTNELINLLRQKGQACVYVQNVGYVAINKQDMIQMLSKAGMCHFETRMEHGVLYIDTM